MNWTRPSPPTTGMGPLPCMTYAPEYRPARAKSPSFHAVATHRRTNAVVCSMLTDCLRGPGRIAERAPRPGETVAGGPRDRYAPNGLGDDPVLDREDGGGGAIGNARLLEDALEVVLHRSRRDA